MSAKSNTPRTKNDQNAVKLELNLKSSRYTKEDYAKMSDGMIP